MSKRIVISATGVAQAFYSRAQGKNPLMQGEMTSEIRSTGRTLIYYLIPDDAVFEGL